MNDLREHELDSVDQSLLAQLTKDARTTNAQLAAGAGVAPSTAHARLRMLESRGIVRGYYASIDQTRLGRGLQAMIGVTLRPGSRRESIERFAAEIGVLPQVIELFFLSGSDDFQIHVAVADSSELREFVVQHLSAQQTVASTRTSVIFAYQRNAVAASFE